MARDDQWCDVNIVGPVTAIIAASAVNPAQEGSEPAAADNADVAAPVIDVTGNNATDAVASVIIEDIVAPSDAAAPVHDESAPTESAETIVAAILNEVIEAAVTQADAAPSAAAHDVLCIDDIIGAPVGPTGPPVEPVGQPEGPIAEAAPDVVDLTDTVDVNAPSVEAGDAPVAAAQVRPASPQMSTSSYTTTVAPDIEAGDTPAIAAPARPASPQTSTTSNSYASALTEATDNRRWVRAFDFSSRPTDTVIGRPIFPELDLAQPRPPRFDVAPIPLTEEVVQRWLAETLRRPAIRRRRRIDVDAQRERGVDV